MNSLKLSTSAAILLITGAGLLFSSCRTSQQEARRNSSAHSQLANGQATLGHEVDSLLLVEEKLVQVIDSMTSLVNADHSRIHNLEREIEMLRQRVMNTPSRPAGGSFVPPPPSDQPMNSYRGNQNYGGYQAPPQQEMDQNGQSKMSPPGGQSYAPHLSEIPPALLKPDTESAPRTTSTPPPNGSNLQDRYAAALRLFNDNSFDAALTAFQSLEQDDPNGPYASNYKYWEGECYYADKRYNQALDAFTAVIKQYPHTTKAPASQFKLGECYERMASFASARDAYQRVLDNYPTSEFRARAQARLKALKPE